MANLKKSVVLCFCLFLPVPLLFSAEQETSRRRLSLKLTGGGGFALIGSVNRCLRLLNNNDAFENLRENDPGSISGEIERLNNWLIDWEIELRMDLSPKWSIGVAVSAPYRSTVESSLSYAMYENEQRGPRVKTLLYRPEARASMPIKLNFYYSARYWKKPKLVFNWGGGYYPARISQYSSSWIDNVWMGSSDWEVTAKSPWGLHVGISLEYPLFKKIFLVTDIQARYVFLKNLQGRWKDIGSGGTYQEIDGRLIWVRDWWDGSIPAFYDILMMPPSAGGNEPDYQPYADFDLTGIVLRIGFRVPLF
jgi:hypothetical protein